MIDLRALVRLMGGLPAALWRDWVSNVAIGAPPAERSAMDDGEVQAAIDRRRQAAIARRQGAIAVVPIHGVIIPRPNIFEAFGLATSVDTIVGMTRAAIADPEVKAVVHDYNSPGGSSAGVSEGHAELMAMRGDKPIVAVSEHLMASAAYWLASAADEIVAAPSALTGSIGAYMLHVDFSSMLASDGVAPTFIFAGEHKVEGNEFEPLSDEARAHYQHLVDDVYQMFTADVASGRGVPVGTVRSEVFGRGRVLTSDDAKAARMIDQVRTLRETVNTYGTSAPPAGTRALAPARRRRALAMMEYDFRQ